MYIKLWPCPHTLQLHPHFLKFIKLTLFTKRISTNSFLSYITVYTAKTCMLRTAEIKFITSLIKTDFTMRIQLIMRRKH